MKTEELQAKIENHPVVKILDEIITKEVIITHLTGGAIIDILDGRNPKDYDVIASRPLKECLIKNGFSIQYETATSITFKREDIIVQELKRQLVDEFDFRIASAKYKLGSNIKNKLSIDIDDYKNRTLVPNRWDKESIINSLYRLPHWSKKRFGVREETYLSMIRKLSNQLNKRSQKKPKTANSQKYQTIKPSL